MPTIVTNSQLAGNGSLGSYNPVEVFAGELDIVSDSLPFEGGQTIAQYQVLGYNAAGNLVPWDPTAVTTDDPPVPAPQATIAAIAAQPITTAAATPARGPVWTGGYFNFAILGVPAGVTVDQMKRELSLKNLQVGVLKG